MKTVSFIFFNGAEIIVFSDLAYRDGAFQYGNKLKRKETLEEIQNSTIYYKEPHTNITDETIYVLTIDECVEDILEGNATYNITEEENKTIDMSMEEHEMYLQLEGYKKYENNIMST